MRRKIFIPPFVEGTELKQRAGFTLIEILVSLVILGVGISVLFNLFPLGLQALSYSRKIGEVSYLAQKKLEEVKSLATVGLGTTSGEEGDLNWQMNTGVLKLSDGVELISVGLDIDFSIQGKPQRHRFITYLIGE